MEIRRWHYYVIFNCVIIKYLEAKTISLNDVIIAESQQKEAFKTALPQKSAGFLPQQKLFIIMSTMSPSNIAHEFNFTLNNIALFVGLTLATATMRALLLTIRSWIRFPGRASKRYSLIKHLRSPLRINQNFLESGFFRDHTPFGGNILSALKYKKAYLIKSPLKPRKLKLVQKSRYKRKNQSAKREINGNEELKQKYIPLLKSLSMLFDNLLDSDSSESYGVKTKKYKRNRFYSEEIFEDPRSTHRSDSENTESESQEETATFSPTRTTAISIITETSTTDATSTTANIITTRDFSAFRQNTDIPVLLPRNTSSGRGDDNGIGERSGATLHGNIEGNITRHHGDHEHATGCGENESCAQDDETNTHGVTRNGARGSRLSRPTGNRNTGLFPGRNRTNNETNSQTETTDDHNRENQFKTGRNETESGRILQEPIRRLRGFILSKDDNKTTKSVQTKEVREESTVNVSHDNAGYQRITDGGSPVAKEIQKVRTGNETTMIINGLNLTTSHSNTPKKKSPVMMIFDGYSTVKHKNGQNKFAEKSIRIHS